MKAFAALAIVLAVAACAGREEPMGSFFDPVCMPDGSVAWRQLSNDAGSFGEPRAKKEYCAWNKAK